MIILSIHPMQGQVIGETVVGSQRVSGFGVEGDIGQSEAVF
mgnify:CR=1 FL=1